MSISDEQARKYLAARGEECPRCHDARIEGGSYDLDTGTIYQAMHCTECGLDWDDAYELNRIVDVDVEWQGGTL